MPGRSALYRSSLFMIFLPAVMEMLAIPILAYQRFLPSEYLFSEIILLSIGSLGVVLDAWRTRDYKRIKIIFYGILTFVFCFLFSYFYLIRQGVT